MLAKDIDFDKEYIHGDKFHCVSDVIISSDKDYTDSELMRFKDRNAIIFCDNAHIDNLLESAKGLKGKYILITHNSDVGVTKDHLKRKPECILKWYGQNMNVIDPCVQGLPIGFHRPRWKEFNIGLIKQQRLKKRNNVNLAFLNHTTHTNMSARKLCENYFVDKTWVTYLPLAINQPRWRMSYYTEMAHSHKFVISPPGNGIDCHRTWEAIYLGSIPIVIDDPAMQHFSLDTTAMVRVKSWQECTIKFLNNAYDRITNSLSSCEQATTSYWLSRISEDRKSLL